MTQDVRGIANYILDIARSENKPVSNLAINKIIYFLHVAFLHEYHRPLVSAKIEAWNHGPVFREIYHQFKKFGRNPIAEYARKIEVASGEYRIVRCCLDEDEEVFLKRQCVDLLKIPAGKLVDMSHVKDGPWSQARFDNGKVNPGVEITDNLILSVNKEQSRH